METIRPAIPARVAKHRGVPTVGVRCDALPPTLCVHRTVATASHSQRNRNGAGEDVQIVAETNATIARVDDPSDLLSVVEKCQGQRPFSFDKQKFQTNFGFSDFFC
jgi:hypothetical protein